MGCRPFVVTCRCDRRPDVDVTMLSMMLVTAAVLVQAATALSTVQRDADWTDSLDPGLFRYRISLTQFLRHSVSVCFLDRQFGCCMSVRAVRIELYSTQVLCPDSIEYLITRLIPEVVINHSVDTIPMLRSITIFGVSLSVNITTGCDIFLLEIISVFLFFIR